MLELDPALAKVLPDSAAVNDTGHLEVGGCDLVELAERFGTPLYVYDEDQLRGRARLYKSAFEEAFSRTKVIFAAKSFCSLAMCAIAADAGLYIDVSTGGEMAVALAAGYSPDRVYLHGNNKSQEELAAAVDAGVGRIVVDSFDEIDRLESILDSRGRVQPVLARITPGVEAHTHEFVKTGQLDSKFGFGIEAGVAMEALKRIAASERLDLRGIHAHIGSQIFALDSFSRAAEIVVGFMAEAEKSLGRDLDELDLGGGLGIAYVESDDPAEIPDFARTLASAVSAAVAQHGIAEPEIAVEPGRSITANAGLTLYRVGTIKEVPGIRTYVAVDGGMSDNLRPMLYDAEYECVVANRPADARPCLATIAGKHCESGDVLVRDARLPETLRVGDVIATPATGAYGWVMSNNYNSQPRPAVVFVSGGGARIVVRRETYEDLLRLQSL